MILVGQYVKSDASRLICPAINETGVLLMQ